MNRWLKITATIIVLIVMGIVSVSAQEADQRYVGRVRAPEFPTDIDWLNVEASLTMEGLRGKIILFDFWTYGCINCIHMIPILRQLEERFADELIVIGVHSAKFDNESETTNIRQIVQRYELEHPVINDSDFRVWGSYGINAWPTFVVIDPRGYIVAAQPGEVPYEAFEQYLSAMIEYYDNNPEVGTIDRTPLEFVLEGAGDPGTPLAFPGKVLADTTGNRLFIADSNHHRIVIADLTSYEILATVGTGRRGLENGAYDQAQFNQPQGMEIVGNILYVADVNNHAIRAIDLETQSVTTIAGTGQIGQGLLGFTSVIREPETFNLRSPWDVALGNENILYIAMAGIHQIWQLDLNTNELGIAIGNGLEAQISETLSRSALAQPSGLHWINGLLYFADSESSTIRVADIADNRVWVIAGTTENNLFEYGDGDGVPGESRLQHALGVSSNQNGSLVYIADTYNSKIRVYDVASDETATLSGLTGNGGYRDGDISIAQFDEPGGLDFADGLLYVADTNNQVIRVIDLETGLVDTIQFPNPEALVIERDEVTILASNAADDLQLQYDTQTISTGDSELIINFSLPEGYKINELVDSTLTLSADSDTVQFTVTDFVIEETNFSLPLTLNEGEATITLAITLFYCEENTFCLIDEVTILVPISVSGDSEISAITIEREVTLPPELAGN